MPYIKQEDRESLTPPLLGADTPGELNYQITCLLKQYIENTQLNYQTINDILGALEGAKLEFYRRVATPYEKTKIAQNGDVY